MQYTPIGINVAAAAALAVTEKHISLTISLFGMASNSIFHNFLDILISIYWIHIRVHINGIHPGHALFTYTVKMGK